MGDGRQSEGSWVVINSSSDSSLSEDPLSVSLALQLINWKTCESFTPLLLIFFELIIQIKV